MLMKLSLTRALMPVNTLVANANCLMMPDRGAQNSSWQRARCMTVVICSVEHRTADSVIWLDATSILRVNILEMPCLPPLFFFYLPHEKICGSMAI
ncbi:hypothetical protein TNCV_223541 [Trichonephila clavipes]|nr:hypothetical protein TNCV_223541 [Trichonephila clavipes]